RTAISSSCWRRISHHCTSLAGIRTDRDVFLSGKLARSVRDFYGGGGGVVVDVRLRRIGSAAGNGRRVGDDGAVRNSSDLIGGDKRSSLATSKAGDGTNCRTRVANVWTGACKHWSGKLSERNESRVGRNVIRDLDRRRVAWSIVRHLQREDGLTSG